MKFKISDITKMLGISRKTLREYDRIGLLSPCEKGSGDPEDKTPWMYSDEDLLVLMIIQIFVTAGYQRNEIKILLETIFSEDNTKKFDTANAISEIFDTALSKLHSKRAEIDDTTDKLLYLKNVLIMGSENNTEDISSDMLMYVLSNTDMRKALDVAYNYKGEYADPDNPYAIACRDLFQLILIKDDPEKREKKDALIEDVLQKLYETLKTMIPESEEIIDWQEYLSKATDLVEMIFFNDSVVENFRDSGFNLFPDNKEFIINSIKGYCDEHQE